MSVTRLKTRLKKIAENLDANTTSKSYANMTDAELDAEIARLEANGELRSLAEDGMSKEELHAEMQRFAEIERRANEIETKAERN
jgi:hypothetical protein